MAFYGNITNTSKTTFSFDRTYSNRYEMDLNANRDGVFVGRYVLVDYDAKLNSQSYVLDTGNESLFLYDDGEKSGDYSLYLNILDFETDAYGTRVYTYADPRSFNQFSKDLDNGRCLVLHAGHVISETNKDYVYVKPKGWVNTEDPNVKKLEIIEVTLDAYTKYWEAKCAENNNLFYYPVTLDALSYEPYTFYQYDQGTNGYILATYDTWDSNVQYYDLGGPSADGMGVVNGYGVYFGTDSLDMEKIYRVKPLHKYKLNNEMQYWAIVKWKEATRLVKNPDYNITDPNSKEYIEQVMEVPVWGQLAAVGDTQGVSHTYTIVSTLPEGADKTDYYVYLNGAYVKATNSSEGPFYQRDTAVDLLGVKDGLNYTYDDDFMVNMAIDRTSYGTSRGYDSTVWQKVYKDGRDSYVMVAELNSVVPTFGVEADAPTPIPLAPHFDPDSTNVYYKLHIQPSWGFRPKFAEPTVKIPKINAGGEILSDTAYSRIDNLSYPSDQTVTWESDFYDAYKDEKSHKYFNATTGLWEDSEAGDANDIKAAIYFNKKGFAPAQIAYSSDLIQRGMPNYNSDLAQTWKNKDSINITPTGHSGMMYDNHGYGAQTTVAVDTQEFSVMLPSIGDTMARIWDMVFGGRDTNEVINQTSRRNMDYEWEDARKGLTRRGLRMVGNVLYNGYNKAEVNTLAGCINSVHDLMGMVITQASPEYLLNNLDNLDEDYIYYVGAGEANAIPEASPLLDLYKKQGQFLMKFKSYEFTPVPDSKFTYEEITKAEDDEFDYSLYYVLEDGEYRAAVEGDSGPFYAKNLQQAETVTPITGLTAFDGTKYYYNDGCVVDCAPENKLKMSDWVREPEYQSDRQYYKITSDMLVKVDVSQEFESGKFYYYDNSTGNYLISFEEEANPKIDYYIIQEDKLINIKDQGYDNVYSPGVYFYKPDISVEHYEIDIDDDGVWDAYDSEGKPNPDGTNDIVVHYYAIKKEESGGKDVVVQEIYYKEVSHAELEQLVANNNFDPSSYYILSGGAYAPLETNHKYDSSLTYFYKMITIKPGVTEEEYEVGDQAILTPYHSHTFYRKMWKDIDGEKTCIGFEHLTANVIREMVRNQSEEPIYAFGMIDDVEGTASGDIFNKANIDITDPEKYALYKQNVFYVPGLYHYINESSDYSDYILDIYPTMWHEDKYYQFRKNPTPVTETFYEPYKYYTKVGDEYVLIKDDLTQNEINSDYKNNIFERKTYYVYKDAAKIFPEGSEWNNNVTLIPPTVTLAERTEKIELRNLEGFARNLNTIHGLILKVNRMLRMNDSLTRDERTVQGAINLLNDKIAYFGEQRPNEVMVVDDYGRSQSASLSTLQKSTAAVQKNTSTPATKTDTMVSADMYAQAASVDDMKGQWITMNVEGDVYHPTFTIHHNFQSVKSTDTEFDMNGNGDTFKFYTPFVDKMGHVVGRDLKTVTLPYGFKSFSTNGVDGGVTQLATTTETVIADSTQDAFAINSGNKWIRMATSATNDSITIAHEIHTPITTAIADTTDLDGSQTFTIQDMQFDAAGHLTHNQAHTYKLPDGVKYVAVGAASTSVTDGATGAGTLEANNHVATFNITPNNRWITMEANADTDTLSIGHAFAGSDIGRLYGDAAEQTPKFGATFKVPYFGVDEAGHIKTQSDHTVTIPLPSLIDGTGDVMTGLALVPEDGKFTVTKTNVGKLTISDFTLGENREQLTNSDSINLAFAKLQLQLNDEKEARTNAINDLDYEDNEVVEEDGKYVYSVKQTDGKIEAVRMALPAKEADPEEEIIGYYVSDILQDKGQVSAVRTPLPEYSDEANIEEDDNMFVYSVKQVAGKIEATRKEFNFLSPETTFAYVAPVIEEETPAEGETEVITPDPETLKTIEWLFAKVAELEARLAVLEPQDETPTV